MKIGKLKKVDIRELWKGEATDFTPWLAKENNIRQLSEEIQIELEVIEQEKMLVHLELISYVKIQLMTTTY